VEAAAVPPRSRPRSWRGHRLLVRRAYAVVDTALHHRILSHRRHPLIHDDAPHDAARWRRAASAAAVGLVVAATAVGSARTAERRRKGGFRNGAEDLEVLEGGREEHWFLSPSHMVASGAFLAAQKNLNALSSEVQPNTSEKFRLLCHICYYDSEKRIKLVSCSHVISLLHDT